MTAFTAFGPMWGFVTTAAEIPTVHAVTFAEPGAAVPQTKRALTTAVHWQRDVNGRLVCHWDRTTPTGGAAK